MNAGQEFLMSKFASSADLHAAMIHEICRLRDELAARSVEPAQCVAEDDADEIMHKVGELVGMSHGAWDMVSARGLVAAFKKVLAPAPHQEPGWQPIETAPKDGRELILLLTPSRFPQVAYSNTWWTSGFSVECKPTHWMPLPAAPKEGRS